MNELFEKYPKSYEKIITTRSIPYVNHYRQLYYSSLYSYAEQLSGDHEFDKLFCRANAESSYNEYMKRYQILRKCTVNTSICVDKLKPDFDRDLKAVRDGKISFETGDFSFFDLSQLPGANTFLQVSNKVYQVLIQEYQKNSLPFDYPFSAFRKGNSLYLAVKEADKPEFYDLFKNIKYCLKKMNPQHYKTAEEMDDI